MMTSSYESIAQEYYSGRHITSRNFDATTYQFMNTRNFGLPNEGFVLELGAGHGNVNSYLRISPSRIIQTDVSMGMLSIQERDEYECRVACDALRLPFSSNSITVVAAFLYDPYNQDVLYDEIQRVLIAGGYFVGTLPHSIWGQALRNELGIDAGTTHFIDNEKRVIQHPSFLMDDEEINRAVTASEMTLEATYDLCLPESVDSVSPHVRIPADKLGISVYQLPLIKLIVAKK